MVARLKSGPKIPKIFGFDLLVYNNCIEFSMELAEPRIKQIVSKDLKLALKNLHSLGIIHHDIRP
jgi:serine/threonine protein kinase